jgi:hypothetical protein
MQELRGRHSSPKARLLVKAFPLLFPEISDAKK